jgi:hypothetical protein
MATNREVAENLLVHYMRTIGKAADVRWDSDNDAEVAAIVDAIAGMVRDEIQEHAENAPHIYADGSTS